MAILRAVFGPFAPEEDKTSNGPVLRWYFFGIRDDYSMANWSLTYTIGTRTFAVANRPASSVLVRDHATGKRTFQSAGKVQDPLAFFNPTGPVHEGTITDILRKHLQPEDLARASALSITKGRT